MTFKKINSYTWVLDDGKTSLQEKQRLIDEQSLSKSSNFLKEKKYRRPVDQDKIYQKFVNEVFRDRSFISQREFNQLLKLKFNSSPTWYRNRMIEKGLIKEANKLITQVCNN